MELEVRGRSGWVQDRGRGSKEEGGGDRIEAENRGRWVQDRGRGSREEGGTVGTG